MGVLVKMSRPFSLPRPLLYFLALIFTVATTLYSVTWMYYIRRPTWAELGLYLRYSIPDRSIEIIRIMEGGNIERAALRVGDKILAVNGQRLDTMKPYYNLVDRGRPGEVVKLTA